MLALVAFCWRKRALAIAAMAVLLLLAVPLVANTLIGSLELGLSATPDVTGMQAVLILGADVDRDREGKVIPGGLTLERLRVGVALSRQTGLPIAVTGGQVWADKPSIGSVMADSLAHDFGRPATWVEGKSADTWENAQDSAALLVPAGIHDVLLVTHAWHMQRSLIAFQHSGLHAVAAPLWLDKAFSGSLVPSVHAWQLSYYAFHEWIGIVWYRLRSRMAH